MFVLALLLVPPAILLAVEAVASAFSATLTRIVHLLFVALLAALIALQALKRAAAGQGWSLVIIAAILGAVAAALYARSPPVRTLVTVLAAAPLLFTGLFIFNTPVERLVFPRGAQVTETRTAASPPIVFVVFDEFSSTSLLDRERRIDAKRYPNFAALAHRMTWYRNATTVHAGTVDAVPALLSGLRSSSKSLPILADHPGNLFTLLGARYAMHAHEPITSLCPARLCHRRRAGLGHRLSTLASDVSVVYAHVLLPQKLARRFPSISTRWNNFRGRPPPAPRGASARAAREHSLVRHEDAPFDDRTTAFAEFLATLRPRRTPQLYFLHILLPHVPWQYLPSGLSYQDRSDVHVNPGLVDEQWQRNPWLVEQGEQRYLAQVGLVDRLVGRLTRQLDATGLWDRSLIVVTADHGVSFRPGEPRRSATEANIQDIAFMPLFMKLPGQRRGSTSDAAVETIDVLPTIADALGVRIPWRTDGRSILVPRGSGAPRPRVRIDRAQLAWDEILRRRAVALRRRIAIFGAHSRSTLFAIGPYPRLLGRDLSSFRVRRASRSRAAFDDPALLRFFHPGSGFVPALVTGRIVGGDVSPGAAIAVAVDGRIAGSTRTYAEDGALRFQVLLPETVFHAGANSLEALHLSGPPTAPLAESLGAIG